MQVIARIQGEFVKDGLRNREYARGVVLHMRKFYGWKVLGYGRCSVVFSCTIVVYCGFVFVLQTGNYTNKGLK